MAKIFFLVISLLLSASPIAAYSAVFNVASGDVRGLIAAIDAANANGEENTITLEPGVYTLTSANNLDGGGTGLPIITSTMTISGAGGMLTIIERFSSQRFRFFSVSAVGVLTLQRLTLRKGSSPGGAAINNRGTLTLIECVLASNVALIGSGGGLANTGTATITRTTFDANSADNGGGVFNFGGTVIVDSSTFVGNLADNGGGLINELGNLSAGRVILTNSTFAQNRSLGVGSAAVSNSGFAALQNTTITENHSFTNDNPGGVANFGTMVLQNTIIAGNDFVPQMISGLPRQPHDCGGVITSLGNNIIGDPTGCTITLQFSDMTGDPGLGAFIDDGAPGHGRFPLLPGSPAIDAGNDSACPATDQLGTPRRGTCDIGAVEFYPVINDLVAVGNMTTGFDATPVPRGPTGTFRITADFTNTSDQVIVNPFLEVVDLSGGNLLLNADGGPGGVGARLRPSDTTVLQPGATSAFEFLIGLQNQERFTFFVNMLGDGQISSP